MALSCDPLSPWHLVVTVLAALVGGMLLSRGLVDRWRVFGSSVTVRLAILGTSLMAAFLYALAAWNPCFTSQPDPFNLHLALAVDVSDSVLRADEDWQQIYAPARKLVASGLATIPDELLNQGTASIITFGQGVAVAEREIPLAELPEAFNQLDRTDFAIGDDSNIEAGLESTGDQIEHAEGRGAVLLISDGNQTQGDALAVAKRLAQRGISVHVKPVESSEPELSITAANLPRQVNAGTETFMRGVLLNSRTNDVQATLTLTQPPSFAKPTVQSQNAQALEYQFLIAAGSRPRIRYPLTFEGVGLQFIDLALSSDDGEGQHLRRFFTHVNQPPQILAIGGDQRWVAALSPDSAIASQIAPEAFLTAIQTEQFDAIVISSVAATRFSDEALATIAEMVEQEGVGLMVMNGDHAGADEETETILMSYNDTPIEPLLPVVSHPRPFEPEPPGRQVVILIDTSGSMGGAPLEKAKEIARYVVQNLLRPIDSLDLIAFTIGAQHLVKGELMDENGQKQALDQINALVASGGTDPTGGLGMLGKMSNCGLIFISDGEFDRVAFRPDCRATVFAIGHQSVPKHSPLWDLADPFPVGASFDPTGITIPYFEPEVRDKFFEPGDFTPLSMERLLRGADLLPVPELSLSGAAVTYATEDADLIAVRPKLTDPILAYRESGAGYVGAFTSGIPSFWLDEEEGRRAVERWLTRLVPYLARDRYDFQVVDHGNVIEIQVSLVPKDGQVPAIDRLTASLEMPNQSPTDVLLRADPITPATFNGFLRIPRYAQTQKGTLILNESGPGAITRPQRIPFLIPPMGVVETSLPAEAYSYGLNRPLLEAITQVGGGMFDPPANTIFFRRDAANRQSVDFWPYLLVAATLFYLAAIALHRLAL